ncbi:hypothetical protein [Streptomyces sp. NPDC001978]|uniref:hypothetical protein n=1 Tax=Streptomyces sp. NPDC001978 TaxID=3364627 RepID=UPI0036BE87C7
MARSAPIGCMPMYRHTNPTTATPAACRACTHACSDGFGVRPVLGYAHLTSARIRAGVRLMAETVAG